MSADLSVFSLSYESIECFFSGVLFTFTSWKEGGEAVAPEALSAVPCIFRDC